MEKYKVAKNTNTQVNHMYVKIVCQYSAWINVFSYFAPLTVKSNQADTGVGPLILPWCALINSRAEILCSDAFTQHLWTPHTLSSQPNFHHQTQHLIRPMRPTFKMHVRVSECQRLSAIRCSSAFCCFVFTQRPNKELSTCESMITSWVLRRLTGGLPGCSCRAPLGDASTESSISTQR